MRIGVDARFLSHALTGGVHTYVLNLARALPAAAPDAEFVFYADGKAPFEIDPLPANVTLRRLAWRSSVSSVLNDLRIGRLMDADRVDVAHYPANYGFRGRAAAVITLHDALNLFPAGEQLARALRRPRALVTVGYLLTATRRTLPTASRIVTVSEHARRDAAARSRVPVSRIDVTPLAAEPVFRPDVDEGRLRSLRTRFDLPARFVLGDAYKNATAVLDAFEALPEPLRAGTAVVFYGREPAPRPDLAARLGPAVRFIARPSTADLAALFRAAYVFVMPSVFEGFGLPLVEAMQSGAPVIASTRGSIPEVVGDAGLLYQFEEPSGLVAHLASVLGSAAIREDLGRRSLARAAGFSWERTARLTLDSYRRAREVR
jgi:glycosyltransferase involved in cell wall biosynthesis